MTDERHPHPTGAAQFVEPGALAYLVTTGDWTFTPSDSVFDEPADKHFATIVDGPYSSYARAEQAADARIARQSSRYVRVEDTFTADNIGGYGREVHGGPTSWRRALTCIDHTGTFGDQAGWQQIRVVVVDPAP